MSKVSDRYVPTIGAADWNIKEMSKDERKALHSRLVYSIVTEEEDYQKVISYMHEKYPDLMDNNPDGMNLQWRYSPRKNKDKVFVPALNKSVDMYAFIVQDPERDYEPVSFGGSYFKDVKATEEDAPQFVHNGYVHRGYGYVLFVDPDYRRMGIAANQWTMEAKLYRDMGVPYQYDIQNEDSLAVTQSLFADPDSCRIVSQGRLKNDGTRAGIRILMNYYDQELINDYNNLPDNCKNFYNAPNWNFLDREKFTEEELLAPWKK